MNIATIMTRDPLTVGIGASLDTAMELMSEHDIRHLPVVSETGLAGVLSDRDVLEATGWLNRRQRAVIEAPEKSVGEVMYTPATTVSPDDSLTDALGLFLKHRIGCLPVLRAGKIEGLVTETDILRAYADACRRGDVHPENDPRVDEHMTADPVTIEVDAAGDEAAELMSTKGVRHLPVLEEGKVVGIVSDRDIRLLRGRGQLELTLVRELMSSYPSVAEPNEKLSSVAVILSAERISALPVVSAERLVGIVTTMDVMIPCALALQAL